MKYVQTKDAIKFAGVTRPNFYKHLRLGKFPSGLWMNERRYWPEYVLHRWLEAVADGLTGDALVARCKEIDAEMVQIIKEAVAKSKAEFQKQAAGHDLSYLQGEV